MLVKVKCFRRFPKDAMGTELNWVQIGDFIVSALALIISGVALWYLRKYVQSTEGIEEAAAEQTRISHELVKAANEQSEGLSRPAVVAAKLRADADPSLSTRSKRRYMLTLKNIGNGPALSVQWGIQEQSSEAPDSNSFLSGELPYIEPSQREDVEEYRELPADRLTNVKCFVECDYQGLSGDRYRSVTELTGNGLPSKLTFMTGVGSR